MSFETEKKIFAPAGAKTNVKVNGNVNNDVKTLRGVPKSGEGQIGCSAFAYNQLTNVTIPSSVTMIGCSAFAYNQLTNVTIPSSVTMIGNKAFYTNQLTSVVIPNSVTTIENSAFAFNRLTSVVIPRSVTWIGQSAFAHNQLTSITIGANVGLPRVMSAAFNDSFTDIYHSTGRAAGTYILRDDIWSCQ